MQAKLAALLKNLFRRQEVDRGLDEELESCLQLLIDQKVAGGMDPTQARREALIQLGGVERVKEEVRGSRTGAGWDSFFRDFRHGLRRLRLSPGFASVAVLTLALGIGSTSAVFSLVDNILLEPLPYPESERLVRVFEQNSPTNRWSLSMADYLGLARWQRSMESVAALARAQKVAGGGGIPELLEVGLVTVSFFPTLGVEPRLGRGFIAGEDLPGADPGIVVSNAYSRRRFGERGGVGETILLDGKKRTIVGVLPPGRDELAGLRADVWEPLILEEPTRRGPFFLAGFGRLRPGVTLKECGLDLADTSHQLFERWKNSFQDETARLTPYSMKEAALGSVADGLVFIFAAVVLVLLIALVNVANLILARSSVRGTEIALRSALGAGRLGLARMLLAEGLSLAFLGGLGGLIVAWLGVAGLRAWIGALPRLQEVSLDWTVVAFAVGVATLSGVLFGMAPLLFGVNPDLASSLKGGGRTVSTGRAPSLLRNLLVALEFALAVPLLVAATLLLGSLMNLRGVDLGFDPHNLLTATLRLPASFYPDPPSNYRFWDQAVREIKTLPGVVEAGIVSGLPPEEPAIFNNFDLLEKPVEPGTAQPVAPWLFADEGYLTTLGLSVRDGRWFDSRDTPDSPAVAVVSLAWADRYFPGEPSIGKQFYSGGCVRCGPTTIVGVVDNVLFQGLKGSGEAVYVPFSQQSDFTMNLVVRTAAPVSTLTKLVVEKLHDLDPNLPLAETITMEDKLSASVTEPRQWSLLLALFAGSAVALALIGVFGVLSYFVSRQKREIGIRMALGASRRHVVVLVARRGIVLALLGIAAGLALSPLLGRWLQALLFGIDATDPLVLAAVSALLFLAATAASVVPGRRAAAIDPREAVLTE